ncbi:acyltransferase family protein [Streptomyces dysideae]|uniref:Acyltransferase n=1 Tax=Streptomyces dysideae TaxID=909626 RepID=A0A101V4L6_9ACTN|nr:acyltransferase [Streptomyces dysideae]
MTASTPAGASAARHSQGGATSAASAQAADVAQSGSARDRYLDLLRAVALLRVVVYHSFGWAWLALVFPSMGVMFALAGSLMARSLQRPVLGVIRSRLRRLLLPLWLYGLVVLGALFSRGWHPGKGEELWWWLKILCWVVPVGTPPFPWHIGSPDGLLDGSWAEQAAGPLWYLRAYFWFVLLSPLLWRMFRRSPWVTLLAPLPLTAAVGTGLVEIPGATGEAIKDFAVYGSCWILGFAHHRGLLRRVPSYIALSLAPASMALGLWWASGHLGEDGWDLNEIPLAQALWSFGFCVLLLFVSPTWRELPKPLMRFDRPITLANNRAVTIYLWHEAAIIAGVPLVDLLWEIPGVWPTYSGLLESSSSVLVFLITWPLVGLLIVGVGWTEDIAAKRRPRLWPDTARGAAAPRAGNRLTASGCGIQ